ncbi:hypothetical protein CVT26_015286, partial [Gymnopilus dilepis]
MYEYMNPQPNFWPTSVLVALLLPLLLYTRYGISPNGTSLHIPNEIASAPAPAANLSTSNSGWSTVHLLNTAVQCSTVAKSDSRHSMKYSRRASKRSGRGPGVVAQLEEHQDEELDEQEAWDEDDDGPEEEGPAEDVEGVR